MKEIFFDKLHLEIYTTASPEALPYNFRSSTNVILENEYVPIDIATDTDKMHAFLLSRV